MREFTYRTFDQSPPEYERKLADALFTIMGKSVHDLASIVAGLNQAGLTSEDGRVWSIALFEDEMRRRGTWNNCIGAALGTHSVPGISRRING